MGGFHFLTAMLGLRVHHRSVRGMISAGFVMIIVGNRRSITGSRPMEEHCIQRPRLRRIAQRRSGQASKLKRQSTASIAYGTWRPPGNESDPQTSASEATDRVEDSSSMKAMLYSRIDMIMTANYDDLLVVTNFLVVVVSAAR